MRKTRWLSVLLALLLVFSLCSSAFAVDSAESGMRLRSSLPQARTDLLQTKHGVQHKAGDQVHAIVLMKSQPLVENRGFLDRTFNTEGKLLREQSSVRKAMDKQNMSYKLNYSYTTLLNGMSVTIDYANLNKLEAIPGVEDVIIATEYSAPVVTPSSDYASDMINATWMNNTISADGSGKVIAVLDTGMTLAHEAFQEYDGMLQTPAYTEAKMRGKIVSLSHGDYYNLKVPFQYDYADGDNNALDEGSDHGSHVAGIAAGCVVTDDGAYSFRGAAPDAQILAMKIFKSSASTTSSDIYFAALEDAYKLGADVINMSIGAPNGFVEDAESTLQDRIYERLEDAGVICCVAAGNEGNMSDYSQNLLLYFYNQYFGTNYPIDSVSADYVDYGVLGSPASYNSNLAVASVNNTDYRAFFMHVGDERFEYSETNASDFRESFSVEPQEFVVVPGFGTESDYEGLDVTGKIALVTRGDITFSEKVLNAEAKGAKGVIVCDNQEEDLLNMLVDGAKIPSIFVTMQAGEAMKALAEAGNPYITVAPDVVIVENPESSAVSSFSSWGPTNDLQIKPTISGVGGKVYSVAGGTTDGYKVSSGTSMATPNAAGGYAALLEALCARDPDLKKAEAAELARNLTASTARILEESWEAEDGSVSSQPFSPRQQGAGLLDVKAAYEAALAIEEPLVALGDDPSYTGTYYFEVKLENLTDKAKTYTLQTNVLTDDYFDVDLAPLLDSENSYPVYYNQMAARDITDLCSISAPEIVELAPNGTATVPVTIQLSEELMTEMSYIFKCGTFVDGYVRFVDEAGKDAAHATFLGFFGNWGDAPIIEAYDWTSPEDIGLYYYLNTTVSTAYLCRESAKVDEDGVPYTGISALIEPGYNYLGHNYLLDYPYDFEFRADRVALSNNDEGEAYADTMYLLPTVIRNARHVIMVAYNADDPTQVYAVQDEEYVPKTIKSDGEWTNSALFRFDGCDASGNLLPDGTRIGFRFYANLPLGEDQLADVDPMDLLVNYEPDYQAPDVLIDSVTPELKCDFDEETGELIVTAKDDQFLSSVYLTDEVGNLYAFDENGALYIPTNEEIEEAMASNEQIDFAMQPFADDEASVEHEVRFDVGQLCEFFVCAMDYATNESYEPIYVEHDHALTEIEAVEPTCEEDGSQAYWKCDLCNAMFADEAGGTPINAADIVIPAPGHDLEKVKAAEPACDHDGNIEYWQCKVCGKLFVAEDGMQETAAEDVVVKATGHKLTAVAEVPATCDTDGAKAHWKCDVCGKLFSDAEGTTGIDAPEVIAKLGHDWDEGKVTKEPTLADDGEKLFTCRRDPSHTKTEAIQKLYECDGADNCPSKDFTDVDRSAESWSHEPIDWAVLKEITNGTTKTTFSPDASCTRAQAVTFLWRAAGCPEPDDGDSPFTDVTLDSWYAKAVLWAVEQGITNGTSETTFSPDDTCTRAQIVTFLWRMQDKPTAKAAGGFEDVPADAYFAGAVDWAVEQGITKGVSDTQFAPDDNCTRAHIVTFLFRQFGK